MAASVSPPEMKSTIDLLTIHIRQIFTLTSLTATALQSLPPHHNTSSFSNSSIGIGSSFRKISSNGPNYPPQYTFIMDFSRWTKKIATTSFSLKVLLYQHLDICQNQQPRVFLGLLLEDLLKEVIGLGKEVERVFGGKQEWKGVMDEEITANWEFPRLRIETEMGEIIKIVEK